MSQMEWVQALKMKTLLTSISQTPGMVEEKEQRKAKEAHRPEMEGSRRNSRSESADAKSLLSFPSTGVVGCLSQDELE